MGVLLLPKPVVAAQEVHRIHWNALVGVRPGHRAQGEGQVEHRNSSSHAALHAAVTVGVLEISDFDVMAALEIRAEVRGREWAKWAHRPLSALHPVE